MVRVMLKPIHVCLSKVSNSIANILKLIYLYLLAQYRGFNATEISKINLSMNWVLGSTNTNGNTTTSKYRGRSFLENFRCPVATL